LNRRTLNIALGLALTAAVIFAVVAIKEFAYASAHPYAYGPANNIAWGALAGALLSTAVAITVNAVRADPRQDTTQEPTRTESRKRGIRRYVTPTSVAATVVTILVLLALSPTVQGYHLGHTSADTTCVTRLAVQFCKDEHARLTREKAVREANERTRECHRVAKEAEEGRRRLRAGSYYLRCLRPGVEARLLSKWSDEERHEREHEEAAALQRREREEAAQRQHEAAQQEHRAQLEHEAEALKAQAKHLTEEEERLENEGKYSQSLEKGEEARKAKEAGEQKLEEAAESG
jgi:uncharacterized membrane protein